MTELLTRKPAYNLIVKLHDIQSDYSPNKIGKLFGFSGLQNESKSWWKGIKGEQSVGQALDTLKDSGYSVFHSVPIGKADSDIDHVVISPKGAVFTVNTKNHEGGKVSAYSKGINVNGTNYPYYRNSKYEATRVKKLFKAKFKVDVNVKPILVIISSSLQVKGEPDVNILTPGSVVEWITSHENTVEEFYFDRDSLSDLQFWSSKEEELSEDDEWMYTWYEQFCKDQAQAARVRGLWGLAGFLGVAGGSFWFATTGVQMLV